jgi:hypothetical protein
MRGSGACNVAADCDNKRKSQSTLEHASSNTSKFNSTYIYTSLFLCNMNT